MRRTRITILSCSIALAGMVLAACATPSGGSAASSARASCSRDTLQKLTDTYVKAQTAGNAAALPFAAGASYTENNKAVDAAKGVLAEPMTIDFTRSFHDTTQCAAFTEVVAATHAHPYVIYTRMEATRGGKVSKMESFVADDGDWVFGATQYLGFTKAEDWSEIPADKRDTREVLQAAADAYLNNWGAPDLPVPHGTPCARLEGRMYITTNRNPERNACDMGAFPEKLNVGNRRYVIDETIGAVSIFHDFPWLDAGIPKDPGTPAGHMFRVEGGKNRYIHESTVCTTPGCGRGRPPGGPPPGGGPGGPGPGAGPGGPPPGAPPPAGPGGA